MTCNSSDLWHLWVETADADGTTRWAEAGPDLQPLSAEELARREAEREATRVRLAEEAEQRRKEREEAKEKATALLRDMLTDDQLAQLDAEAAFLVEAERRYRITRAGKVTEVDAEGREVAGYCIHCGVGLPGEDEAIGKMLLIQNDEAAFQRIANRWVINNMARA